MGPHVIASSAAASSKSKHFFSSKCEDDQRPPSLPTTCCMSGCANCVWLDYADEVVDFYSRKGESGVNVEQILKEVEENVDDEMVKAFIKMEIKFKFRDKMMV